MKNNEAFILYVQFLLPPWWNVFLFLPLCDLYELCTLPFLVEEIGFSLTVGWTPNLKRKKNLSFFFFYIRRQKKKKRLLRCPRMAQRHGKVASHENKEKRKFYFLYVYIRVTLLRLLHIVPPPPSSWVSCIHEKKNKGKASLVCLLSTTEPECSSEWCHFPFPSFTLNHVLSLFILWTPLLRRVELNLASKWRNERPNTICTQHTYTYRKKARLLCAAFDRVASSLRNEGPIDKQAHHIV